MTQPLIRILSTSGVTVAQPATVPTKEAVPFILASTATLTAGLFICAPAILMVALKLVPAGRLLANVMAVEVAAGVAPKTTAFAVAAVAEKIVLAIDCVVVTATTWAAIVGFGTTRPTVAAFATPAIPANAVDASNALLSV